MTSHWYTSPEEQLVIVGVLTFLAIWWQSKKTAEATNAMGRQTVAMLRPKLLVKHVFLVPGRDVTGDPEGDREWKIGCIVANVGGSLAHITDSSLTIHRLGVGTMEGLLPAMPPYDKKYQFGSFAIEGGERQEKTTELRANEEIVQLRLAHSTAQHRRDRGLPASTTTPIVCFGYLRYRDESRVERLTGFGWSWNADDMSFTRLDNPDYEYAD